MRRSPKWIAKMPLAPVIAGMFGLIALTLVFMTPVWLLERLVGLTGLPALIPAAQPPLGGTARSLCAIAGGLGVFLLLWLLLTPLQTFVRKRRPQKAKGSRIGMTPISQQTPAMKRPPIFAERELGAPFMSDEAIASANELSVPQSTKPDLPDEIKAPPASLPQAEVARSDMLDLRSVEGQATRLVDEMARLEAALVRRNSRGEFTRPRAASDPVHVRTMLHHMG